MTYFKLCPFFKLGLLNIKETKVNLFFLHILETMTRVMIQFAKLLRSNTSLKSLYKIIELMNNTYYAYTSSINITLLYVYFPYKNLSYSFLKLILFSRFHFYMTPLATVQDWPIFSTISNYITQSLTRQIAKPSSSLKGRDETKTRNTATF